MDSLSAPQWVLDIMDVEVTVEEEQDDETCELQPDDVETYVVEPDAELDSDSDTEDNSQVVPQGNDVGLQWEETRRMRAVELDEYAETFAPDEDGVRQSDYDLEELEVSYVDEHGVLVYLPRSMSSGQPAVIVQPAFAVEPEVTDDPAAFVTVGTEGCDLAVGEGHSIHASSGRGRGHGRSISISVEDGWVRGDRLREVYLRDEDIPDGVVQVAQEHSACDAAAHARSRGRGRGRGQGRSRDDKREDNAFSQEPSDAVEPEDEGDLSSHPANRNDDEDFTDDVMVEAAPFLFNDDPKATNFDWRPMDSCRLQPEEFVPTETGPTRYFGSAYDSFRAIWTDDILDEIALETNRHASRRTPNENYVPTNRHEILILFTFFMLLGLIQYPTIDACFSRLPLYCNASFSHLFSRARYYWLNRNLHFVDNLSEVKTSRLSNILPIIVHLNRVCKTLYVPKQNIAIDESLTLWRGILNFKKSIKACGIKIFEICCSKTGFLWSFFVYTGTDMDTVVAGDRLNLGCPKVVSAVLSQIRPLLNQGYRLWLDSWFNSPYLARYLKMNGTDCCGTLRVNRLHVPRQVTAVPLEVGQFVARHTHDMSVLSWRDNRRITIISTFHGNQQMPKFFGPEPEFPRRNDEAIANVYKPTSVREYNKNMRGIDRKNKMLEQCPIDRIKCRKWFTRLFKRLLNVTVLNSRILVEQSTGLDLDHVRFREDLIHEIVKRHLSETPTVKRHAGPIYEPLTHDRRYDLTLGHFTAPLTDTDTSRGVAHFAEPSPSSMTRPDKRKTKQVNDVGPHKRKCVRKRCIYCVELDRATNNKTTLKCTVCDIPLCAYPCFALYHSKR